MGTGRAAYQTATGQALVVVAIVLVVACWMWAGRIMVLPEEQRVFAASEPRCLGCYPRGPPRPAPDHPTSFRTPAA